MTDPNTDLPVRAKRLGDLDIATALERLHDTPATDVAALLAAMPPARANDLLSAMAQ